MSIPRDSDPANVYRSLMAYPEWYRGWLSELADQMTSAGVEPRLAITELQIFTNKRELPNNGTLSEAIYMGRYFHTAIRLNGLVEMITHSALVNHGGGLRKERGVVYALPSWWATHLYGTMRGTIPVAIRVKSPVYGVEQSNMPTVKAAPYIDAVALKDGSGSVLTVMLINSSPGEAIPVSIELSGWPVPKWIDGRRLTGSSFMDRNTVDHSDRVKIEPVHEKAKVVDGRLRHLCSPCSITELVLQK
jgi:alpha-N-arabinofuranosidase